jgi:alkylation response protein AidB-like acyl-CoA dehydrogenase
MNFETHPADILALSTYASDASGDTVMNDPAHEAASRMLADIKHLAPSIAARAAEMEAARRIPLDLVETLRSIGVFRMLAPRSHGGLELDLPDVFAIMEALSRIDGSFGWTATVGSGAGVFASLASPDTFDQIYRDGPDVIFAGSVQPTGTAEAVKDGWLVNGRWPFASGCQHADWILAVCVMTKNGQPLPGPVDGTPMTRFLLLPARCWRIEDTWHAVGLKASGSHHVVLQDVLVPGENFIDPAASVQHLPGPLYNGPFQLIPLMHCPIALGIAEAALEDIIAMAHSGRRQLRAAHALRDSEVFQSELGRAQAELRAARAYFEVQTASHWKYAQAGALRDEALLLEGTQASVWITDACLRVAETCFQFGGGSAVYGSSPLQRRLRDLQTAAQHAAVQQRHYVEAGKLLLSTTAPA